MAKTDDSEVKLEKYKQERAQELAAHEKNVDELIKQWGEGPDEFMEVAKKHREAREGKLKK